MLIGLESFSYLPWLMAGRMDVFGFIRRAKELGLDGVQLNIGIAQDNWGVLAGADPERLHAVRAMCEELELFVEVDTRTYDHATLLEAMRISAVLGADTLRTYISTPDELHGDTLRQYMEPGGGLARDWQSALPVIRGMIPLCEQHGIRLAIENHEYETAAEVVQFVQALDSEWVGTLIDVGNMMTVWEDPVNAVTTMAPWAVSTHFKDHAVIIDAGEPYVVGVPLGQGSIDLPACYRLLADRTQLTRICIEVCYGYRAGFRIPASRHATAQLGRGAFRVMPSPHDPACVAPYPNYQNPAHLPPDEGERFLQWVDAAVVDSVAYVKALDQMLVKGVL